MICDAQFAHHSHSVVSQLDCIGASQVSVNVASSCCLISREAWSLTPEHCSVLCTQLLLVDSALKHLLLEHGSLVSPKNSIAATQIRHSLALQHKCPTGAEELDWAKAFAGLMQRGVYAEWLVVRLL
jgi:hypothetical protein